jgi:hypothetical protein
MATTHIFTRRSVAGVAIGGALIAGLATGARAIRTNDENKTRIEEVVLREQQEISACMREAGFEWVVALPPDVVRFVARQDGRPEPNAISNPNADIEASLPAAERAAYADAQERCNGAAEAATIEADPTLQRVASDPGAMERMIASDPAYVGALAAFQACVATDGIDAASDDDLYRYTYDRWVAVTGVRDVEPDLTDPRFTFEAARIDDARRRCAPDLIAARDDAQRRASVAFFGTDPGPAPTSTSPPTAPEDQPVVFGPPG